MNFSHEIAEHLFGNFEIGNDAIFHRAYGDNISRCAANHVFRIIPDSLNLVISIFVNCDY